MSDFSVNLKPNESSMSGISFPTNGTPLYSPHPDPLISSPLYISISVASVLGNFIMVMVILCKQSFRKPVNLLVANLSFSSLLFIISSNLRLAENAFDLWPYSDVLCQTLSVLHRIPVPVIALTTMNISLNRGKIARNPMLGSNSDYPVRKIICIWAFSLLILLPLALTRSYDPCTTTFYKCKKIVMLDNPMLPLLYGFVYLLSVHIIPAVILVQETTKTISKIRFLKVSGVMQHCSSFPNLPDHRLRLLRNSCFFCLIFLIFWLPYGVFQFPLDLPKEVVPEMLSAYLLLYFKFCKNITYCLIALNPVILFVLSYDLFKHVPSYGDILHRRRQWRA